MTALHVSKERGSLFIFSLSMARDWRVLCPIFKTASSVAPVIPLWLVGWLACWLVGWLAGCLVVWLAGWLGLGWLVGWLAGWLVGWFVSWLVC